MTYEKKPKEFIVKSIDDGEYIMPANMLAVSKEDYDELTAENAKLRAENYVLRDQGLRTYDGLADKADRADELQRKLEIATKALKDICWSWDNDAGRQCSNLAEEALKEIGE